MPEQDISFTDFMMSSIHDMKNSLSLQIGHLEGIAAECRRKGDAATAESLGLMIYEAGRMNANLVQLLSLYRFGKSIYPLDIVEQPVYDVIEDAVLLNKSIVEIKGIAVTIDCPAELVWYMDRDLVTGILINALNNAYNYTSDRIRVAAQKTSQGQLELRVEDNGRGYPDSMLGTKAFAPSRGSNFLSGSTGLGFHFAAQAVAMHADGDRRGSLTLENGGSLGGGCFVVRLP